MTTGSPSPNDRPAELTRWLNEDALRTLETLLGRELAGLERIELRRDELLSIAGAFGLPLAVRMEAGKRLQQLDAQSEIARRSVRELRTRIDTLRRHLGLYRPPPRLEREPTPAEQRAARLVVDDLLRDVHRKLSARAAAHPPDVAKLQNEANLTDAGEDRLDDDLDWSV